MTNHKIIEIIKCINPKLNGNKPILKIAITQKGIALYNFVKAHSNKNFKLSNQSYDSSVGRGQFYRSGAICGGWFKSVRKQEVFFLNLFFKSVFLCNLKSKD